MNIKTVRFVFEEDAKRSVISRQQFMQFVDFTELEVVKKIGVEKFFAAMIESTNLDPTVDQLLYRLRLLNPYRFVCETDDKKVLSVHGILTFKQQRCIDHVVEVPGPSRMHPSSHDYIVMGSVPATISPSLRMNVLPDYMFIGEKYEIIRTIEHGENIIKVTRKHTDAPSRVLHDYTFTE